LPGEESRTDEVDEADVAISFLAAFFPTTVLTDAGPFLTVPNDVWPLVAVIAFEALAFCIVELVAFPVESALRLFVVAFFVWPTAFVLFAGFAFVALTLDLLVFVPFVTVFAFPFVAFFGVMFDRTEAFFVAAFFFGLDLATTLAFFGLAFG